MNKPADTLLIFCEKAAALSKKTKLKMPKPEAVQSSIDKISASTKQLMLTQSRRQYDPNLSMLVKEEREVNVIGGKNLSASQWMMIISSIDY